MRRFLDAVVGEPVFIVGSQDQPGLQRLLQVALQFCLGGVANHRQQRNLPTVSQAGELLQGFLGCHGQPAQLVMHELHDVVRVPLGVDANEIPGPDRGPVVELQQAFLGEDGKELDGEERIAGRFSMHQRSERRGATATAVQ